MEVYQHIDDAIGVMKATLESLADILGDEDRAIFDDAKRKVDGIVNQLESVKRDVKDLAQEYGL